MSTEYGILHYRPAGSIVEKLEEKPHLKSNKGWKTCWFILRSICLFQKRPERVMHGQILLALGKVRSGNAVATNTASGGVRSNKACTGGVMLPYFVSWRSMNKFKLRCVGCGAGKAKGFTTASFRSPTKKMRSRLCGTLKSLLFKI